MQKVELKGSFCKSDSTTSWIYTKRLVVNHEG